MKLVLLGTTGYHPNNRRQTACYMLPELGLVLDAGSGMYRVRDYLKTPTLDIYLTHAHLDHSVGLSFLFDVLSGLKMDRVTVHGEEPKLVAIRDQMCHELLFPVALPCEYRVLNGPMPLAHGGRISYFPLIHPGGAVGYRLDWPNHSMAYVSDTTAQLGAAYIEAIRGVDLLIHECNFADEKRDWAIKTGHSFTTPVAQVAKEAGAKRLLMVHLDPTIEGDDPIGIDVARKIFPNTILGEDLMEIDF